MVEIMVLLENEPWNMIQWLQSSTGAIYANIKTYKDWMDFRLAREAAIFPFNPAEERFLWDKYVTFHQARRTLTSSVFALAISM